MGWDREFDPPIITGLKTLRDAANHIIKLPRAEQAKPHWQLAAEVVLMAAEDRGPMLHAVIGMNRALDHGKLPPNAEPRRKRAKKFKIVR
jgi:hypothetical protein